MEVRAKAVVKAVAGVAARVAAGQRPAPADRCHRRRSQPHSCRPLLPHVRAQPDPGRGRYAQLRKLCQPGVARPPHRLLGWICDTGSSLALSNYRHYAAVTLGQTPCHAMIDSGNLLRCAISKDLMVALGLSPGDLKLILGLKQIGTAKEGASLGILGLPLRLKFDGSGTFFSCQPIVIGGLSMPFNISCPFLKEHSIDQLHSQDALLVCGQKIQLLATQESRQAEVIASAVYVSKKTVVPAFKEMWIPAHVSEVKDGKMTPRGWDHHGTQQLHAEDRPPPVVGDGGPVQGGQPGLRWRPQHPATPPSLKASTTGCSSAPPAHLRSTPTTSTSSAMWGSHRYRTPFRARGPPPPRRGPRPTLAWPTCLGGCRGPSTTTT